MAENGEEKLLAMARHIAKTLGRDETMADDILQIFSSFDGRFSRERLAPAAGGGGGGGGVGSVAGDENDPRGLERAVAALERQILQYVNADHPIWSDSADAAAFLDSLDDLIATVRDWSPVAAADQSVAACLARADDLLQQGVFRLEEEFRLLMERGGESFELTRQYRGANSLDSEEEEEDEAVDGEEEEEGEIAVAQPLTDYGVVIDALPSGTINDLHEIARRMVAAGFGKECSHVYSSCRREFLEESVSRLGLRKLSIAEAQKLQWAELEDEIDKWIKAANVALRILFPSERRLCDRVFFGFSSAADLSFMEVCRGTTVQILNFVDAIAIGTRSPERLFKVLDLFEMLRDLMPEFESNFSDQYCVVLRNDAVAVWKRLGEAVRGIFMELENLIRRDPARTRVPGGGLHPITRYVMNYLRAACRSRETLEQVFDDGGNVGLANDVARSSLGVQMVWIMELLESNLEMKAKIYDNPALSAVFMMNNGRYIVQKVKDSELGTLLGDDWIRKHLAKIRQFHTTYQRTSWNGTLEYLRDTSKPLNAAGQPMSMRERMKAFSTSLDNIYKAQSQWVIFDEQLRKELRVAVANLLIPAYNNFIPRFRNSPEVGKHYDKYLKYSSEELEALCNRLFQGGTSSAGSRK
ncbi:hypothetical protein Tsubulata_032013 [Turnera subulata]|uniref:Exocyst subunit Exo70 family protein n=1 Tax=Turnera subulata TaxID=218843 RepID=A0A9Q0JG21_9ROSI|nr:hypothetical protein Tsubulata_032013 [Turnera subulata]